MRLVSVLSYILDHGMAGYLQNLKQSIFKPTARVIFFSSSL